MFFDRAPVNHFSRALSCGFSTELLLAYRALGGCHGNMVLCVLLTRASYRNKVPSTICTASALSSTLRGSSIDGTFKVRSVAFVHFEKTFNLSCFHSVGIWPWQPVWLIEKEASATSGVWDVTTARACWWGGSGFYQLALLLLNQISKVHTFCLWPVSWTHVWNMSHGFNKHHNHLQCQVTLPVVGISPMIY